MEQDRDPSRCRGSVPHCAVGQHCYDNRDCPYPETCYYGQCVTRTQNQRCNSDLDCGPGYRCINSVCQ